MQRTIDSELLSIAQSIVKEDKSDQEWSKIESCDMLQEGPYCGGYEATEQAFTFSYSDNNGDEWWFQLTLPEIRMVVDGSLTHVSMRAAMK